MLRVLFVALFVVVAWMAIMTIIGAVKKRAIDWTGIAFVIGFVVMAFYLRDVTGLGG